MKYITLHLYINTSQTQNLWLWPKRPPSAFSVAETSVAEMSRPKCPWPKCPWLKCPSIVALTGLFPAILGKGPCLNLEKMIYLTSKLGEINDIEHNKGNKTWYWEKKVAIFDWEWGRNSAPREGQNMP